MMIFLSSSVLFHFSVLFLHDGIVYCGGGISRETEQRKNVGTTEYYLLREVIPTFTEGWLVVRILH